MVSSLRLRFVLLVCISGIGLLAGGCSGLPEGYPFRIKPTYGIDDPQFARTMDHLLGPPLLEGNAVQTLINGDQIFPAMLEAIHSAKTTITFETFIYWKGGIGQEFTDALAERAAAGVKVHLLIDAVGGNKIDDAYVRKMTDAHVAVQFYHPLRWFDLSSAAKLNNRTHRKLLVIDGRIGFTGGVGIADEWAGHAQDKKHWHDTHYKVTGPAVADLQAAFADHWIETNGGVLHGDAYFPKLEKAGDQFAQVFKSGSDGSGESMQLMYLLSFSSARKTIRLATAYFVPDELTIRTLIDACKRGVKVQVVIPGKQTDVPATLDASRASWGKMLAAGVEIYQYEPTMYHTKLMIVDDLWVSIGSANLDNRSFRLNGEANLNALAPDFAAEQVKMFDEDLQHSRRVTYEEWKNRPFGERFKEAFASILKFQL